MILRLINHVHTSADTHDDAAADELRLKLHRDNAADMSSNDYTFLMIVRLIGLDDTSAAIS